MKPQRLLILALLLLTAPVAANAQVVPAGTTQTQVQNAPNGVPVVNIANPNASGLSHNQFNSYNVDSHGLVLNNGAPGTALMNPSQLAGQVTANMNLTKSANVILNEVVQPNRSLLAGYTEVVGAAADVIVANPYGVTCSGCGFINTPNVTITTGTPVKDGAGALTGFQVDNGDILITGTGADGAQADYLGLIARSIKLDAQVNAKALDIVAGANDWDYATRAANARAAGGTAPTVAIDSSALGGMYADRIRLIATENGVGVKLLGEAASGAGDFTIDASGKIEIGNKLSAGKLDEDGHPISANLSVTSHASGADAIKMTDQTLSATNNLSLSATSGTINLSGGTLTAGNDLSLLSANILDAASASAAADNNKRYAGRNLTATQTGTFQTDGITYGAGGALDMAAAGFTVNPTNGGTFYGDSVTLTSANNISLDKAVVKAANDITLTAASGAISTAAAGKIASDDGDISLTANSFTNAGLVSALSGAVNTFLGTLTNSGTVQADTMALNIGSTLTNSNDIVADHDLTLRGLTASSYSVSNGDLIQSKSGKLDIKGYNAGSAVAVSSTASGALFAGNTVDWKTGAISLANGSGVKSTGALTLNGSSLTLGGSGAYVYAGGAGTLTLTSALSDNASIYGVTSMAVTAPAITITGTGGLASGGMLTATANNGSVLNYGALYAGSDLTVNATDTFHNYDPATVDARGNASFTSSTFENNSDINVTGDITVSAATFLNQVTGGDNRHWNYEGTGFNPDPSSQSNAAVCGNGSNADGGPVCPGNGNTSAAVSGTWSSGAGNKVEDEGDLLGGWDVWEHVDTWQTQQYYLGGKPTKSPNLISGGTLTVKDFYTGKNLGGLMSGNTIILTGATPSATFTNDNLALERDDWKATWYESDDCWLDGLDEVCVHAWYHARDTRSTYYFNRQITNRATYDSVGGGLYANTLQASNFTLYNNGSTFAASDTASKKSGGAQGASVDTTGAPTTGTGNTGFAGLNITLPTNPNGFFIQSQDPNSGYLIETNPKFADPNLLGSDYLAKQLGVDTTEIGKRLGDAGYEQSLVRQQLISQLGTNLIDQGGSEAQQMQTLMDSGASVGKKLGLEYGKAPTAEQLANAQSDFVWMVETTVNGQKVLAPVVYLSDATKSMFDKGGAVIAANKADMNLTALSNTGGTISGKESLNVTSKGDITNTSGTISGGDVSLTSTMGSIVNKTVSFFTGDDRNGNTVIGKTGNISSTGDLSLDAKKDITNIGADMSAGKDASLKAGENITFDTIVDKKASTTEHAESGGFMSGSSSSTTESSSTNIGSNLKVGGNLKSESGKDTTIRGSNVDVGGNGSVKAGGDLKVLDVQDEHRTTTSTSKSGVGVGGGVYGSEKETNDHYTSNSKGSNLNFGGDADLSAGKDLTIQGSDVSAKGDTSLSGDSVNILEGRNIDETTHTKETTTFLSIDKGSSSSDSSSDTQGADADASAGAHASAEAGGEAGLSLAKTTKEESHDYSNTSKGSNVKSGGNLTVKSNKDTTVRGSNVEAGGNVDVNAGGNLNLEAAEDTHTHHESKSTTDIGLHASSSNKASAGADAQANADGGGAGASANGNASKSGAGAGAHANAGDAKADASAKAGADASSESTLDLVTTTTTTTDSKDVTHTGSTLKSGGNTNLKAGNDVNVKGSSVDAGGDLSLDAKDINVTASQDTHSKTTTSSTTKAGIYVDANAGAHAEANASAGAKDGASADASVDASAKAGAGLYGTNTTTKDTEDSTHANTSSLKSGGDMTRNASGKITDEGTQIDAGGDFTQNAAEWESKAAQDTHSETHSSETNTAKVGVYAEAGASASAKGEAAIGKPSTETDSGADASAGGEASYHRDTKDSASSDTHATTSTIKAGGNVKSTTTGKTSLEGTSMESGGDMELNAESLDYKAAHDTHSDSTGSSNVDAHLQVGLDATKAVTGEADAAYGQKSESNTSSTAVTGSMKSGGNLKVNTKNDATFEGTNIEAGKDASVKSENGNVTMNAAHNTETHSESGLDVSAQVSASKGGKGGGGKKTKMGAEASASYEQSSSEKSDAVTGSIKSGGKLDVSAGKNATFEGTALESGGDASIDAKGDVTMKAAQSTEKSSGFKVGGEVSASKGGGKSSEGGEKSGGTGGEAGKKGGTDMGAKVEGEYSQSDSSTATTGSIKSGGGVKIKSGNDTTLEGTNVESKGKTAIDAGGNVNLKAATDSSTNLKAGGSLEAKKEGGEKSGSVGVDISGGTSTTKKTGSINAGEIDIKSGKDTTVEGGKLNSKGDTSIDAGGNLNLDAAKSSHVDGSLKGGYSSEDGASLKDAGIGGGVTNEGVEMNTGGNLKLKSGGTTTMTGTKAKVDGSATIDAKGGVKKKAAVSGGAELGTSRAGADLDVQGVDIDAKGGVTEP